VIGDRGGKEERGVIAYALLAFCERFAGVLLGFGFVCMR
jgi:hypothetical protein